MHSFCLCFFASLATSLFFNLPLHAADDEPPVLKWHKIVDAAENDISAREQLLTLTEAGIYPDYLKHWVDIKKHLHIDEHSDLAKLSIKELYALYFFRAQGQVKDNFVATVKRCAKAKDPYCSYLLAEMLYNGWRMAADPKRAKKYLKNALKHKLARAQYLWAKEGANYSEAIKFNNLAVDQGFAPAIYERVKDSRAGLTTAMASDLWRAANLGLAEAQLNLAFYLENDYAFSKGKPKAFSSFSINGTNLSAIKKYLKLAMRQRHVHATYTWGQYLLGGSSKNQLLGTKYCLRAIADGYISKSWISNPPILVLKLAMDGNQNARDLLATLVTTIPERGPQFYRKDNFATIIRALRKLECYYLRLYSTSSGAYLNTISLDTPSAEAVRFIPNQQLQNWSEDISDLLHEYIDKLEALDARPLACVDCLKCETGGSLLAEDQLKSIWEVRALGKKYISDIAGLGKFIDDISQKTSPLSLKIKSLHDSHKEMLKILTTIRESLMQGRFINLITVSDSSIFFLQSYLRLLDNFSDRSQQIKQIANFIQVLSKRQRKLKRHIKGIEMIEAWIPQGLKETQEHRNYFFLKAIGYPNLP